MEAQEQQEKKQFSVPGRDQLIQQIKDLDQDIEHVALNLIKCDFNATEKDIEKTFPDFKFIKIKNYNPGSFEVIFEMRIDAINFIKNHYDKKILNRRFFIKMGRQQKQLIEKWTGVGNAPRNFRGPNRPHNNRNQQQGIKKPEEQKTEQLKQGEKATEQPKTQTKQAEVKTQTKTEVKKQIPHEAPKKQGKIIPKSDNHHHKKPEYKKPVHHDNEKKAETHVKKDQPHHPAKKEQSHHASKKEQHHYVAKKSEGQQGSKKQQTHHQPAKKEEHHYVAKKPEVQGEKKEAPKKQAQKKTEHHEQKKQEDDEWIVVPSTGKNSKRR